MRAVLPLMLLAGCSAPPPANDAQVDLNGAAERAQDNTGMQGGNAEAEASAPTPAPAPAIAHTRYRCMDGSKIALRLDRATGTLTLSRDGKPVAMLASRTAERGFRYANGAWELSGAGDMAMLSAPGLPPITCKAIT